MPDIRDFPPEVIEQAKRLLEVKERILDVKRNLPNAAYPAQLRGCIEQLTIAIELAIFGKLTEAGSSQMVGASINPADGGQKVQIFMPTTQVPAPEQPAIEILRPAPEAPAPQPVSNGSVQAAMEALSRSPAQATPPPVPVMQAGQPIMGGVPRGALDPVAAAAMAAISAAAPRPAAMPIANQQVEIFPPGDPRAPQPAG